MSFNLSRPSDINFLFGIMTDYNCQFLFNTIKRIYLTLLTGLTDITKKPRNKMERSSETQWRSKKVNYRFIQVGKFQTSTSHLKSKARWLKLGQSWVFQQDNDPKHTSKLGSESIEQPRLELLDWPSKSLEFNPIENLLTMFKSWVGVRKLNNINQLYKSSQNYPRILQTWEFIKLTTKWRKSGLLLLYLGVGVWQKSSQKHNVKKDPRTLTHSSLCLWSHVHKKKSSKWKWR